MFQEPDVTHELKVNNETYFYHFDHTANTHTGRGFGVMCVIRRKHSVEYFSGVAVFKPGDEPSYEVAQRVAFNNAVKSLLKDVIYEIVCRYSDEEFKLMDTGNFIKELPKIGRDVYKNAFHDFRLARWAMLQQAAMEEDEKIAHELATENLELSEEDLINSELAAQEATDRERLQELEEMPF